MSDHRDKKSENNEPDANTELSRGAALNADENSKTSNRHPDPPNWVEKGTLIALVLAFIAAVFAGYEAKRLADGTDELVRDGQKALTSVQRAFVYVTGVSWNDMQGVSNVWVAQPYWENSGNTPATSMIITLMCPSDPNRLDEPLTSSNKPNALLANRLLGPKQTFHGGACAFDTDILKAVQREKLIIYVIAQAAYGDVFGEFHITEFCEELFGIVGDIKASNKNIVFNTRPCLSRNCADEECASYRKIQKEHKAARTAPP